MGKPAGDRLCRFFVSRETVGGFFFYFGQYRTKIVRQMRRQIFRQMKQKAE
ncbi:hypothetical protein [Ruminococcus callidus]|uniref:hypothetical protein n=1 Tax=Ruminococcus callidus TaxID=40519 RepID=UPI003521419F